MTSKEQIIIKDFIKEKSINHIYLVNSQDYALSYMKNNNIESMSYDDFSKIYLFNVEVLTLDNNGNYSFIYPIQFRKKGDIIDNISITSSNKKMKCTFLFEDRELENIKQLVICAMGDNISLKLKFSFSDKPSSKDEIFIQSCNYILSDVDRNLIKSSLILSEEFTYDEGTIKPCI